MILNENLYYDYSGAPVTFLGFAPDEWRTLGRWLDKTSLIADPRFEAPERRDFRLKADSPAWRLGVAPVDISGAGPRAAE